MPRHMTESVVSTVTAKHDFTGGLKTDVVSESTSAAGVSVDQVLCKDGAVTASGGVTGDVIGDVTGDVTGDVAGDLTGAIASLTGDITVSADDTHDLGANDKRMANVFTKKISGEPFPGFMQRPKFTYSTTTAIKISAGSYYHCGGTKERLLYWDSELTYTFGSLGASDWSYLYLDDSAIDTADTNLIAIGQMTDVTTEPAWSHTKHGWYNGHDLCIGAVLTSGASEILEFFHDGGDYVLFADRTVPYSDQTPTNSWDDVTLVIPAFAVKAEVTIFSGYIDTATQSLWRTNGQTAGYGHFIAFVDADVSWALNDITVITDDSQIFEVRFSAGSAGNLITVYLNGWYFPHGM